MKVEDKTNSSKEATSSQKIKNYYLCNLKKEQCSSKNCIHNIILLEVDLCTIQEFLTGEKNDVRIALLLKFQSLKNKEITDGNNSFVIENYKGIINLIRAKENFINFLIDEKILLEKQLINLFNSLRRINAQNLSELLKKVDDEIKEKIRKCELNIDKSTNLINFCEKKEKASKFCNDQLYKLLEFCTKNKLSEDISSALTDDNFLLKTIIDKNSEKNIKPNSLTKIYKFKSNTYKILDINKTTIDEIRDIGFKNLIRKKTSEIIKKIKNKFINFEEFIIDKILKFSKFFLNNLLNFLQFIMICAFGPIVWKLITYIFFIYEKYLKVQKYIYEIIYGK